MEKGHKKKKRRGKKDTTASAVIFSLNCNEEKAQKSEWDASSYGPKRLKR